MLHCFSMDVEGFCEGSAQSCAIPPGMIRSSAERQEIAKNIDHTLEFLEQHKIKGTFFILGIIAKEQPEVVRKIAQAGHEIGSHSYRHLRLFDLSAQQARDAIVRSKQALEDAAGVAVHGFRAPEFSINQNTLYLLDEIRNAGYSYDSSIYPIGGHDVYGIRGARTEIHTLPNGLVEFPPTTINLCGRVWPALGGGYFRLYPLSLSRLILKRKEQLGRPVMYYTHPYELGGVYPRLHTLSWLRRARRYINIDFGKQRLTKLFADGRFGTALAVLREQGYDLGQSDTNTQTLGHDKTARV